MKEKMFDPFYSTKGERGTGLGLSQVYGFVESSGGVIEVSSEIGKGTTLSLYFPRYEGDEGGESGNLELEKNLQGDVSGSGTILLVDDEPALLELNSEILSHNGYRVICAQSAKKALELLEKVSFDLMISDVVMPDMNGYELAAIVKDKYPSINIQLVSGFNGDLNEVDKALESELLSKPFDALTLLQRVRKLLDGE